MKKILVSIIYFGLVLFTSVANASNFSGTWVAVTNGHDIIISIKQNGNRVSGKMWPTTGNLHDPKSTIEGRVNGRELVFSRSIPHRYNFQKYKAYMYKGEQGMAAIFSHKDEWVYGWQARKRQY